MFRPSAQDVFLYLSKVGLLEERNRICAWSVGPLTSLCASYVAKLFTVSVWVEPILPVA